MLYINESVSAINSSFVPPKIFLGQFCDLELAGGGAEARQRRGFGL